MDTTNVQQTHQRVLILDEPSQLKTLTALLEEEGFCVLACSRAAEALAALDQQCPDVVLLELDLPDSRGLDTVHELMAHSTHPVCIIVTDCQSEQTESEAIALGVQDYLVKIDLNAKSLSRALRHAVDRRRTEYRLRESDEKFRVLFEWLHQRIDGTVFPAEVQLSRVELNGMQVLQALVRDITERKRIEEEWATTFDSITDLISVHDKGLRLTKVNKAFADAFGMKPEDLIGRPCYEIVHGATEPWPGCPCKRVMETGQPHVTEFFEDRLGAYLQVSASPVLDKNGDLVGFVHLTKNITERKQAEQRQT